MEPLVAIVAGTLLGLSIYGMLHRSFIRMVIGVMVLGNAVNLIIFTAGRLTRGAPPIIPHHGPLLPPYANPLPQALMLTAIVISFALTAFALTLAFRVQRTLGTLETDEHTATEPPPKVDEDEEGRLAA